MDIYYVAYHEIERRYQSLTVARSTLSAVVNFLREHFTDNEVDLLHPGVRWEQPWSDTVGRLFDVRSLTLTNGGRVWVYRQTGGFEHPLNNIRDWNPQ